MAKTYEAHVTLYYPIDCFTEEQQDLLQEDRERANTLSSREMLEQAISGKRNEAQDELDLRLNEMLENLICYEGIRRYIVLTSITLMRHETEQVEVKFTLNLENDREKTRRLVESLYKFIYHTSVWGGIASEYVKEEANHLVPTGYSLSMNSEEWYVDSEVLRHFESYDEFE